MDELDRILSADRPPEPSAGFCHSVMAAVRREAATPPPIPFPWRRALPGAVVGGAFVLAALAIVVLVIASAPPVAAGPPGAAEVLAETLASSGLAWAIVALVGSYAAARRILQAMWVPA